MHSQVTSRPSARRRLLCRDGAALFTFLRGLADPLCDPRLRDLAARCCASSRLGCVGCAGLVRVLLFLGYQLCVVRTRRTPLRSRRLWRVSTSLLVACCVCCASRVSAVVVSPVLPSASHVMSTAGASELHGSVAAPTYRCIFGARALLQGAEILEQSSAALVTVLLFRVLLEARRRVQV